MKESKLFYREIMRPLTKWVDRKEIFAVKGPRQAGKTTVLRMLSNKLIEKGVDEKHIFFYNFEDRAIIEAFVEDSKKFVSEKMRDNERYYFFMDEYQYVPDGGQKLKLLYDLYGRKVKFVISGSSSLELADKLGKYLVGRVFFFELLPFSFYEFLLTKDELLAKNYLEKHNALTKLLSGVKKIKAPSNWKIKDIQSYLEEYVRFGGYPEVIKARDVETKKKILNEIYNTYISKDVIELLKITDAFRYRNLIKTLAVRVGNMLNYEELSSSCESYYKEIRRWVSVLNETYIVKLLWPFFKNPSTELRKTPKLYFYDFGLRNLLMNNFNPLKQRSDASEICENFVLLSLLHLTAESELAVNYWRTIAKAEVDFILNRRLPIEVKSGNKEKITRSFRSFLDSYNPKCGIVTTSDRWSEQYIGKTKVYFVPLCYF